MKDFLKKLFKKKERDRDSAIIKLVLWLLFIAILLIVMKIASIYG